MKTVCFIISLLTIFIQDALNKGLALKHEHLLGCTYVTGQQYSSTVQCTMFYIVAPNQSTINHRRLNSGYTNRLRKIRIIENNEQFTICFALLCYAFRSKR